MIIGKIPPQAIEFEETILGACLIESTAYNEISALLKPEHFYKEHHQIIYKAISKLGKQCKPIDIITVTEQLKKEKQLDEIGGPVYITQLTNKVSSAAHIIEHSKIIIEKYIRRRFIYVSSEINNQSYDESIELDELIEYAEKNIFGVFDFSSSEPVHLYDIAKQRIEKYEKAIKHKDQLTGISSGHKSLDEITNGWQDSDLIVMAARPGQGKTFEALHFSINASELSNCYVLFFSVEMSSGQLTDRLFGIKTKINTKNLQIGRIDNSKWKRLEVALDSFKDIKIYLDDSPDMTIHKIRAKARKFAMKIKNSKLLIIIDYLQLLKTVKEKDKLREREVAELSREAKQMAKELNCPVIAVAQLNRDAEGRRPNMANLRESGAIEQDTDIIIFPYREKKDDDSYSNDGLFIIAKHRNGPLGEVTFKTCETMVDLIDPLDKTDEVIQNEPELKNFSEPEHNNNGLPF
ncbi:MAG: replicative DNA helicase [Candidatus Odinarchaeota archaeon]